MSLVSTLELPTSSRRGEAAPPHRVESVAALEIELTRHLARCRRQGDLCMLLWIEVDVLARVDPALGVRSHDAVVQALSARLRYRVRRTDFVFQVDNVGFAVLLGTDKSGAHVVSARLTEQLRGPYGMDGCLAHVHVNIGVAAPSEALRHGSSLLQYAMDDMYTRRLPPPEDSASAASGT